MLDDLESNQAIARIVTWIQDQRAGRNPRLRAGHIMSDEAAG
jgi:hypothetical protein